MTAQQLRSRNWFGRKDLHGFAHRSWTKSEGFSEAVFDGRPVIGIANSWSELTTCNAHLRQVAEAVKRGVWSAGGFPLEFPTVSLGEVLLKPTALLFRNLMSMAPRRKLTLRLSDEELARRRAAWKPRAPHYTRGYGKLFLDHVLQADEGVDVDFLRGKTPVRFEDSAGPSHA